MPDAAQLVHAAHVISPDGTTPARVSTACDVPFPVQKRPTATSARTSRPRARRLPAPLRWPAPTRRRRPSTPAGFSASLCFPVMNPSSDMAISGITLGFADPFRCVAGVRSWSSCRPRIDGDAVVVAVEQTMCRRPGTVEPQRSGPATAASCHPVPPSASSAAEKMASAHSTRVSGTCSRGPRCKPPAPRRPARSSRNADACLGPSSDVGRMFVRSAATPTGCRCSGTARTRQEAQDRPPASGPATPDLPAAKFRKPEGGQYVDIRAARPPARGGA
jgi:hypothetical protein